MGVTLPKRFYIYAFIDPRTNDPIYVGKGKGRRAWNHLYPCFLERRQEFFYDALREMKAAGVTPIIIIVRDNLTEDVAYKTEALLINLVGTRLLGTGPLFNTRTDSNGCLSGFPLERGKKLGVARRVWNQDFASLVAVSEDPRCLVPVGLLRVRVNSLKFLSIEQAAETPPGRVIRPIKMPCWGDEEFPSLAAIGADPRCLVSRSTFIIRVEKKGWSKERAATEPASVANAPVEIPCWGEIFPTKGALANDKRCVVSKGTLHNRLAEGLTPEQAATMPLKKQGPPSSNSNPNRTPKELDMSKATRTWRVHAINRHSSNDSVVGPFNTAVEAAKWADAERPIANWRHVKILSRQKHS